MSTLLDLGDLYISDFLLKDEDLPLFHKYRLRLVPDPKIGAVRLDTVAPPGNMYGKYWYRSGINASMKAELKNIVETITSRVKLTKDDIWIDIGCNDGTLLSYIPTDCKIIGIDPANNEYVIESQQYADLIIQDFFSKEVYQKSKFGQKQAKVITSIAMFYDLDDPHAFVESIKEVLAGDGLWVLQLSYTPLMLQQLAFDNICHEHIYYYDLTSLEKLFSMHGLKIVDVDLNDTNGGSFRVYVQHESASESSYATAPIRDIAAYKLESFKLYEQRISIRDPKVWEDFAKRLDSLKTQLVSFVKEQVAQGKTVWGYGASTKGNTLLQYFGLDHTCVTAIAERSHHKWGLRTIGTNIPIVSEAEMRAAQPDYLLILPWHFISEFKSREAAYLEAGGKFIVPCPHFQIVSKGIS